MTILEQDQLSSGQDPNKQPDRKTRRNNALVVAVCIAVLAVVIWLLSR